MDHRSMLIFGLHGSRDLAERVAARLEVRLASHEERGFEDGEHKARPLQSVRGQDVFVLHALHGDAGETGNDKLCRLLFFCGALKDAGAARVTAVAPYLCYARKDRRTKPNDPVTTRYLAAMFEAVGIDQVIAAEVHNLAAFENAFRIPTWHVESAPLLAAHCAPLLRGETVAVVSPDAGGAKRAEQFRQELERLIQADLFATPALDSIIVTDTVPPFRVPAEVAARRLTVLDASGSIARAIAMCHEVS
jgi:ribose-phosphate pyrophosphokinase